jgi:outer membrane protein TolC
MHKVLSVPVVPESIEAAHSVLSLSVFRKCLLCSSRKLVFAVLSCVPLHVSAQPSIGVHSKTVFAPTETVVRLSAAQAVKAALTQGLQMRSAVSNFLLQSQRLTMVSRKEFDPKLGMNASASRNFSASNGQSQSSLVNQVALDLNWRLRTGATIKINPITGVSNQTGGANKSSQSVNLSVSQPLFKGASRSVVEAGLESAESAFRLASESLKHTAENIAIQALDAYLSVQQTQAALMQARQSLELARKLYVLNQALVSAGRSPRIVLLQSEIDVSSARLSVAQADNALRLSVRALAQTMGQSNLFEGLEIIATDNLESSQAIDLLDEQVFVALALDTSYELFAARELMMQAKKAFEVAKDGLLPSVLLNAAVTKSIGSSNTARSTNHSIGITYEYNFDRNLLKVELSEAQRNLDTAQAQLQNVEQQVRDGAKDALKNLAFAREQSRLSRINLDLSERQLDAEVTRHSLGRSSQLELSNAQQFQATARRQLLDTSQQAYRSHIELMRIDGSLLRVWGAETLIRGWLNQAKRDVAK